MCIPPETPDRGSGEPWRAFSRSAATHMPVRHNENLPMPARRTNVFLEPSSKKMTMGTLVEDGPTRAGHLALRAQVMGT